MKKGRDGGVWGCRGVRAKECRDEEEQGCRDVGTQGAGCRCNEGLTLSSGGPWSPRLPAERPHRLLRAVPRCREVAAAAERGPGCGGGAGVGGFPRGMAPAVGSGGIPAALLPFLRLNPFPGPEAALGGSCGGERGCPPPSPLRGGRTREWGPDTGGIRTRVGSGCAPLRGSCTFPQLLCIAGERPAVLARSPSLKYLSELGL